VDWEKAITNGLRRKAPGQREKISRKPSKQAWEGRGGGMVRGVDR